MYSANETWRHGSDATNGGLSGLFARISHSLFGAADLGERPPSKNLLDPAQSRPLDDDMGWLSLTSDADGHSSFEGDVICMGVTPDDLDLHDPDGGDLSWIGLSPVKPNAK